MKRFVLLDSHAIIHRAYHALPPLTSPTGEPVGAVYGFTAILLRILRELAPDYIVAAFDLPGPTFRHIAYERYKATRPETPSDLASQFEKVRRVIEACGILVLQKEGYEADDIIGTIASGIGKKKNVEVVIVTGDMDTLQLVRPGVRVCAMKKGISETVTYDDAQVEKKFGFAPKRITDFKGLKGDPSDNIPGVKGIGDKTATELIKTFGSIEGVYKALKKGDKKISASIAEKLRAGAEDAQFSKDLATIRTDVPIKWSLEEFSFDSSVLGREEIRTVLSEFGFSSLIKRIENGGADRKEAIAIPPAEKSTRLISVTTKEEWKKEAARLTGDATAFLLADDNFLIVEKGNERVVSVSQALLSDRAVQKWIASRKEIYAHDAKAFFHFLRDSDIPIPSLRFDTMLASYVADTFSRDFSFPAVAARALGRLGSKDVAEEAMHFFEVVQALEAKLAPPAGGGTLREVYEKIELPLVPVLLEMETRGVKIDSEFLGVLAKKVDKELRELTLGIFAMAGETFNINSTQQLSRILFEKLGMAVEGLRKTGKRGVVSTGAAELEKLKGRHPIIEALLRYRELMKLKSTYIDALPKLVSEKTGRLHTTYNQAGTATGRLSSSDPNLQNIPILSEDGKEIRKAFVADNGFLLVSFDYSQIELRVAAHMADDKKMIDAFRNGADIHKITAAEVYNVPLSEVTPELRRAAKTLNFGVLYGMGVHAFAEATGMSRADAKKFIDEYFHDFSGIRDFIERTKRFVADHGYVETLFGRRRYIPEAQSSNWQMRREAERMAVNMPIQGTATGDIVKMAMIAVDEWTGREKLERDVRMLLQVHDELVFEIKKDVYERAVSKIKEAMEGVAELKVPLVVDVKAGKNWGEQSIYISGADGDRC